MVVTKVEVYQDRYVNARMRGVKVVDVEPVLKSDE
jgi:hypothetical protein